MGLSRFHCSLPSCLPPSCFSSSQLPPFRTACLLYTASLTPCHPHSSIPASIPDPIFFPPFLTACLPYTASLRPCHPPSPLQSLSFLPPWQRASPTLPPSHHATLRVHFRFNPYHFSPCLLSSLPPSVRAPIPPCLHPYIPSSLPQIMSEFFRYSLYKCLEFH